VAGYANVTPDNVGALVDGQRLAGTNVEEGRKILAESGLELITAETLAEAADKAVAACNAAQEPGRARA
jgi:succinyl-CoA synthetase beta subunit